jgi:hypothetical protein
MSELNYGIATREQLEQYNRLNLNAEAPGVFTGRDGRVHDKWHVLAKDSWRKNFLDSCKQFVVDRKGNRLSVRVGDRELPEISLHRYFHHLNSSQALCLNLFLPLIHEGKVNWFLEHRKIPFSSGDLHARFEEESPWEDDKKGGPKRKTSFDFYVEWAEQSSSQHVFVEVKYSEQRFGGAKDDKAHQAKFSEVYESLLARSHEFFSKDHAIDCSEFLCNYQILRNLVHIRENSHVVFLVPKGNRGVVEPVKRAMEKYLSSAGQERCHLVFLEDFLDDLLIRTKGTVLETHFRAFEDRYFPSEIRSFGQD